MCQQVDITVYVYSVFKVIHSQMDTSVAFPGLCEYCCNELNVSGILLCTNMFAMFRKQGMADTLWDTSSKFEVVGLYNID